MRKIVLLLVLLAIGTIAFSQEITVRFTGQLNNSEYCRLDSVKVTNLTRDWTETIEYPDTIIVLGGTVGTDLNIAATQGLGQNIPNPFDCETRVELSVSQRENVRMQLLDASGRQYADYSGSLDAGVHTFDISAAAPQTYVLNATVGSHSYSIRMVNMGSGCGSSIKYAGISGSITAKLTTANEFHTGDNMRYVGYTTIGGQVVASDVKEQAQVVSQYVTLSFTNYSAPAVETLAATDITTTSAILHGNITYDGGTEITARGFYWGTAADNLSQMVSAESGAGTYSVEITGLSIGNTYYYCAFATNGAGTAIGEVMSFAILVPTVQTNAATSITTTEATLNGNVISDGGATVTSRGFYYGTSASNLTQSVQCGGGTGEFATTLTGLNIGTTYYYKTYATNSSWTSYGDVLSFTTTSGTGTLNGRGWVDLGLPSGLCWATCNVGANSPVGYGDYFAWGETTTKDTYTSETYRYFDESGEITKYCSVSYFGYEGFSDNLTSLESSDDAATVNWGAGWRMPTKAEFEELNDNCTKTWTTQNGVNGQLFTGPNGNSIFLPVAGYRYGNEIYDDNSLDSYYWSSSLYTEAPLSALNLTFRWNENNFMISNNRYMGQTVRPVCTSSSAGGATTIITPSVTTGSANSDNSGTTISGNVTFAGGATVTVRGFYYGTSASDLTQNLQCGSGTGEFTATLTNLTIGTTYYYKAYATNSAGTSYGEVKRFTISDGTTGTLNGHEWVDLGLPSGVLWATCNVGASHPENEDNYYAWGETTPKDTYNWSTYRYCNGSASLTKYCNNAEFGYNGFTDNLTILSASDDAAAANWGDDWRMPTKEEMEELFNNCTFSSAENGIIFIGPNGNSIFFPSVSPRNDEGGYVFFNSGLEYWSSSVCTNSSALDSPIMANGLSSSGNIARAFRYCGYPVRPVRGGASSTTGTLNGHDWVDLGLPSGTRWATCNVGAPTPEAYGDYYAWGETTTKTTYSWSTYRYCNGSSSTLTKYCNNSSLGNNGFTDALTTLESSDDAATANWGSAWRMPTKEEFEELKNNCTVTWTTRNGVNGRLFTGPNGNSIFLPAAGNRYGSELGGAGSYGYYWSRSLHTGDPSRAWYLYFDSGNYLMSYDRSLGQSVRPVCAQ